MAGTEWFRCCVKGVKSGGTTVGWSWEEILKMLVHSRPLRPCHPSFLEAPTLFPVVSQTAVQPAFFCLLLSRCFLAVSLLTTDSVLELRLNTDGGFYFESATCFTCDSDVCAVKFFFCAYFNFVFWGYHHQACFCLVVFSVTPCHIFSICFLDEIYQNYINHGSLQIQLQMLWRCQER